jgi:hypothetical protein
MAPPTSPTKNSIVIEGLKRFLNGGTPSAAEITRAENFGLEKVKRDIMLLGKTWHPLIKTSYQATISNQSRYDNPSDFEQDYAVSLMSGLHTDTLSVVTSTTNVTLKADENATVIEAQGKWLLLTAGTGANQAQQIKTYSATTKVAVTAAAYATAPVMGDTYTIVNSIKSLTPIREGYASLFSTMGTAGTPVRYYQKGNATTGQLVVHPAPSGVFGLRRDYYADLMTLDITEGATTLYTTILTRWADVFEQGIFVWRLVEDDDRYQAENSLYQDMLTALMARDLDGYAPQQAKG